MSRDAYEYGETVVVVGGRWQGHTGVVSWPIRRGEPGYVLIESSGWIAGRQARLEDVALAEATAGGCTQLTYRLMNLASLLIERRVLPLAK
jgi:hypothetical protein